MNILLKPSSNHQIEIYVNKEYSHSIDISNIHISSKKLYFKGQQVEEIYSLGRLLYDFIFPAGSLTSEYFTKGFNRIVLFFENTYLQEIPWEFMFGPKGFLVLNHPFLRGVMHAGPDQRKKMIKNLRIISVLPNPIDEQVSTHIIESGWQKLKQTISGVNKRIYLERCFPPTIDNLKCFFPGKKEVLVLYTGKGIIENGETSILFENRFGDSQLINPREFFLILKDEVHIVVLENYPTTAFGDSFLYRFAYSLGKHNIPYSVGMRYAIPESHAGLFSRSLCSELTKGISIEKGVLHARRTLVGEKSSIWLVGMPILYTSVKNPISKVNLQKGHPITIDRKPKLSLSELPISDETHQARNEVIKLIGKEFSKGKGRKFISVCGGVGQGKSYFSREVAERFSHIWNGGVIAISLAYQPRTINFISEFARFLDIDLSKLREEISNESTRNGSKQIEELINKRFVELVISKSEKNHSLVILDNAEVLTDKGKSKNKNVLMLVETIQQMAGNNVTFLVNSQSPLRWVDEKIINLNGLQSTQGARLFWRISHKFDEDIDPLAFQVSEMVDGNPLCLKLLGQSYIEDEIDLNALISEFEHTKLKGNQIHQRSNISLNAAFEFSFKCLPEDQKKLLSCLSVFQGPFIPGFVVGLFLGFQYFPESKSENLYNQLSELWRKGFLEKYLYSIHGQDTRFYRLIPTFRPWLLTKFPKKINKLELNNIIAEGYYAWMSELFNNPEPDRDFRSLIFNKSYIDVLRFSNYLEGNRKDDYLQKLGRIVYKM